MRTRPQIASRFAVPFFLIPLLLSLYVEVDPVESVMVPPDQLSALLDFKSKFQGSSDQFNSWNSTTDCEEWQGIQCDQLGKVISININGGSLNGSISEKIGSINTLQKLYINNVNLYGTLPDSIGNLVDLQYLSISPDFSGVSGLRGSLPSTLGQLTNLIELTLSNNRFVGSIPDSFSNLVNLQKLDLSQCALSSLTDQMKSMKNLWRLSLNNNLFSGKIPDYIGELTNLSVLNLYGNLFEGEIPKTFINLTKLEIISLIDNNMNGTLPDFIGNLTSLREIHLSRNSFYGSIPSSIGNLIHLEELTLKNNSFSGSLPPSLGNLVNLTKILAYNNNFTGSIPSSFGNLLKLNFLQLNNNNLQGGIPVSFKRLFNLTTLHLQANNLSGDIPFDLKSLVNLQDLNLNQNSFSGKFPAGVLKVKKLQYLDLSNNNFSGALNFDSVESNLLTIKVNNNRFTNISTSNSSFKKLIFFDASNNQLPSADYLSFAPNLETLKVSGNKINGKFFLPNNPLTSLSILVLDDNQISSIDSLDQFTGLTFLSLMNNRISSFPNSNSISGTNLTVLVNQNLFCSKNTSVSEPYNRTGMCSTIPPTLYTNFPYTNLSSSEIIQNPNLVDQSHPCNDFCAEGDTFYVSDYVFETTGECKCAEPLQFFIRFESPSFTIFTQKNKKKMEKSIAAFHRFPNDASRVQIHSIAESHGYLVAEIFVFPGDISDQYFPLSNAYSTLFPFTRDIGAVIGASFGPFNFLNSSTESIMKRELSLLGRNLKEVKDIKKKKDTFPLWGFIVIFLSIFALVLILAFIAYKFMRRRKNVSNSMDKALTLKPALSKNDSQTGSISHSGSLTEKSYSSRFIPLSEIRKATDDFAVSNMIGSGGYGEVYRGISPLGKLWAVKRAKFYSERSKIMFLNEVQLISEMNHKNLVRFLGYCDEGEHILVYEFIPNGTLRQNLIGNHCSLNFLQRVEIAFGTAQALNYLHSFANQPIIHRDIKTENILLDEKFEAKLADFGLLKHMPAGDLSLPMSTRVAGTPGYMDPEYYKTFRVTAASDVYSFGVVLLEIITGKPSVLEDMTPVDESYIVTVGKWVLPYVQTGSIHEIIDPKLKSEFETSNPYPLEAVESIVNLAYECMQEQGKSRPSMEEVAWKLGQIRNSLRKMESRDWSLEVPSSVGSFDLMHGSSSKEYASSFDSAIRSKEFELNLERP